MNVFAAADNAVVDGSSDPDTVVVRGSNDTISGFGADDIIFAVGDANLFYGDSTVQRGDNSGVGNDVVVGGSGNDTIWGGAGADTLQGGGGADTFSFGFVPQATLPVLDSTTENPDLIVDFSQAGGDVIDLSSYRLYPALPAVFLGTAGFTSDLAFEIRYETTGAFTAVQFRVPTSDDPTTPASLTGQINLAGVVMLTANEFAPALTSGHGELGSITSSYTDEDAIISTTSNTFVEGTDIEDTIVVFGNNDTIFGYGDDDLIFSVGSDNILYGDSPQGFGPHSGTGDDTLIGGSGDDTLWGGAGADIMSGGLGADTFSFGWVPQAKLPVLDTTDFQGNNDLIVDFDQGQSDRIDLTGYLANGKQGVFLATDPFTDETVLQVRYDIVGEKTVLEINVPYPTASFSGATTAEIVLASALTLTNTDFVLA